MFNAYPYRGPRGAGIFSCTLLHEKMPVTQATRYVMLPFPHDAPAPIRAGPPPDSEPQTASGVLI